MKTNEKYLRDLASASAILEKKTLTADDKMKLLAIYNPSVHTTGKIKGITSLDGSAIHCEFCKAMKAAAEKDPTIVCGDCYISNLDNLYKEMTPRHWLNQRIMSETLYSVKQLESVYIATKLVRVNSDGDMRNTTQAVNMLRLAKAHKQNKVAIWFKNKPAMKEAIAQEGKPKNVIIIYSACRLNESPVEIFDECPWVDYVFTVYADKTSIKAAIESGANECNGKHCDECGYKCYNGAWKKKTVIAEYLRGISKEKRAKKIEAIKARQEKRTSKQ